MVPGPIFKRSDGRGNCKMGPGTIFYEATWQSLKKRKKDEHREVIEYAV